MESWIVLQEPRIYKSFERGHAGRRILLVKSPTKVILWKTNPVETIILWCAPISEPEDWIYQKWTPWWCLIFPWTPWTTCKWSVYCTELWCIAWVDRRFSLFSLRRHRSGRTARGARKGKVTALITKRDKVLASAIEQAVLRGEPLDGLSSTKSDYQPGVHLGVKPKPKKMSSQRRQVGSRRSREFNVAK